MEKEMKEAFERLKKEFPGRAVSIEADLATWNEADGMFYQSYLAAGDGIDCIFGSASSPSIAVDLLTQKRKEELDNKKEREAEVAE